MVNASSTIYIPSQVPWFERRPNCWTRTTPWNVPCNDNGVICLVRQVNLAVVALSSYSRLALVSPLPATLWEMLVRWDCLWMWDHVQLVGDTNWLSDSICTNSCIAVADGSFIWEITTEVCSTSFFFENTARTCKIVGAFPEHLETANAYHGKLLGLMVIHLLLMVANKVAPGLTGSVTVFSDCERAIGSIETLTTLKIPAKYKHSDILKNILVNCTDLSFQINYEHILAHQDDDQAFHTLSRPAQLNCAVDAGAKAQICELDLLTTLRQHRFPLEPIVCFAGTWKLTASMTWFTRFYMHKQLARTALADMDILSSQQFNKIAWLLVAQALEEVLRIFQLWACKQVLGICQYKWVSKQVG
jgi:hypothetical protein